MLRRGGQPAGPVLVGLGEQASVPAPAASPSSDLARLFFGAATLRREVRKSGHERVVAGRKSIETHRAVLAGDDLVGVPPRLAKVDDQLEVGPGRNEARGRRAWRSAS
jgi:hypothetical protein